MSMAKLWLTTALVVAAFWLVPSVVASYFSFTNSTSLFKSSVFLGNSSFGSWIGDCGSLACTDDPYTAKKTCTRQLYFYHEEEPFSYKQRSWHLAATTNYTTNSDSEWCRVMMVKNAAIVFDTTVYSLSATISFSRVALNENGFDPDNGKLWPLGSITTNCGNDKRDQVFMSISNTGTTLVFALCDSVYVYRQSSASQLWEKAGEPITAPFYPTDLQLSDDGRALLLQRKYETPKLYEVNATGLWAPSVNLPNSEYSDTFLLAGTALKLLKSEPTHSQVYYQYTGRILVYARTAAFAEWETTASLIMELDPGARNIRNAELHAKDWVGNDTISAIFDEYDMLFINFSNPHLVTAVEADICSVKGYFSKWYHCPEMIKGRNAAHPVFLSIDYVVSYPLGVQSDLKRTLFFVTAFGAPGLFILAIIVLCCCRKCCGGSRRHSRHVKRELHAPLLDPESITNTSSSYQSPTFTAPPPAYPSVIQGGDSSSGGGARLEQALSTVRQGVLVALVGLIEEKMSLEDSIMLIALAVINALRQCQVRSKEEFQRVLTVVTSHLNSLLAEVMTEEAPRLNLIELVLQKVANLLGQSRSSNVEEALGFIRHSLEAIWQGLAEGKTTNEQATQLMVVVGLAALRNCTIESATELQSHMDTFSRFMNVVADQCASSIPTEVKRNMVSSVWGQIAAMF